MNEAWPGILSAPRRRVSPVEGGFHPASCRCCGRGSRPHRRVRRRSGRASDRVNGVRAKGPGSLPDERRPRSDPNDRPEGEGPVLCGSVDERRAGKYMAEVRTSSQSERPCAAIEETRTASADAGGSKDPGQRKVHSLIDKVYAPANLAEAWRHVRDKKGGAGIEAAARIMSAASKPAACKCSRANQGRSQQNRVTGLARRWPPWVHNRPSPTSSSMHFLRCKMKAHLLADGAEGADTAIPRHQHGLTKAFEQSALQHLRSRVSERQVW